MRSTFGDQYYDKVNADDLLEEAEHVEDQKETAKLLKRAKKVVKKSDDAGNESDSNNNSDIENANMEEEIAREYKEAAVEQANALATQQGMDCWFACDGCLKPIVQGHFHYDCLQCDNFSFCERCYKSNKTHLHSFNKGKVPKDQAPPGNSTDLINKAYMCCCECGNSLIDVNKRVFYCKECSGSLKEGDVVYWCKSCQETTEHEHKRSKLRGTAGLAMPEIEE